MPEPEKKPLSAVEVLSILVERVRRIESEAAAVRAILSKMIERQGRKVEPGQAMGPEPVATP